MTVVRADSRLLVRDLGSIREVVQVQDERGRLLGVFVPSQLSEESAPLENEDTFPSPEAIHAMAGDRADAKTTKQLFEKLLDETEEGHDREKLKQLIAGLAERRPCNTR